jgi:hypothetical protein
VKQRRERSCQTWRFMRRVTWSGWRSSTRRRTWGTPAWFVRGRPRLGLRGRGGVVKPKSTCLPDERFLIYGIYLIADSLLSSSTKATPKAKAGMSRCAHPVGGRTRGLGRAVAERSPSRLSSAAARGALAARRIYRLSRKCPCVKPSARCPCPKPQRPAESPGPRKIPGPPSMPPAPAPSRRPRRRRPSGMRAPQASASHVQDTYKICRNMITSNEAERVAAACACAFG